MTAALAEPCSNNTGAPVPAASVALRRIGGLGSHVHFHAEFMPGEGRSTIDRIIVTSIASCGLRLIFCPLHPRTASMPLLRVRTLRLRSRYAVFNPVATFR